MSAARALLGAIFVALLVAACTGGPGGGGGGYSEGDGGLAPTGSGGVKVALLLPLSGSGDAPQIAQALRQAGELALFEFNNPNVTLVPKDTKGTPQGAAEAAESAVSEKAELIIGPLFADEVRAVAPVAGRSGIPVIAFSSDRNVAGNNVYLMSFLAGADVGRIASYALSRGKKNFAVLIPESAYGTIAEREFAKAVASAGGRTVVRATYPTGGGANLSGPVGRVAGAVKSGQQVDALFLPAGPDELRAIGPLLASNGIAGGKTQLLGTGLWNAPGIGSNSALVGGWYPRPIPAAGTVLPNATNPPMAVSRRGWRACPTMR
ncbi:penicillin-binding protein activator [Methyloligella halotolerans]|nr:penicillin-binding protein activator [Methyloligella halotolerans]